MRAKTHGDPPAWRGERQLRFGNGAAMYSSTANYRSRQNIGNSGRLQWLNSRLNEATETG
jgi:hypothetical protein